MRGVCRPSIFAALLLLAGASAHDTCAGGQVFTKCGKACTSTCDVLHPHCTTQVTHQNLSSVDTCLDWNELADRFRNDCGQCVPRCQCPPDAPAWDDDNGVCLKVSQCAGGANANNQEESSIPAMSKLVQPTPATRPTPAPTSHCLTRWVPSDCSRSCGTGHVSYRRTVLKVLQRTSHQLVPATHSHNSPTHSPTHTSTRRTSLHSTD
jgi:hypothetical protein